jgi:hypothetical protein
MIRWLLTPIMRPIARRKLNALYAERELFNQAIERARKSKKKVSYLYQEVKFISAECHRWEKWFQ